VLGTFGKALAGQGVLQQCESHRSSGRGEHSWTVCGGGGVVGFFSKPEALEAQLKKYAAVRV
jgi:hypothetical protein